jgi:SAM-dependent methyltransferase
MVDFESPRAADFASLLADDLTPSKPVNFQLRTSDEIRSTAEYAVSVATNLGNTFAHYGIDLEQRSLLEIGPGIGFGSTLLVGEKCSEIGVLDAYLAPWQKQFHPQLYRDIRGLLGRPSSFLDRVNAAGNYRKIITTVRESADSMKSIEDEHYDVILSNAVLEHVGLLPAAIREMYRVTKRGGDGFHQVDFRCHRNFDLSLEHLLLTDDQFQRIFEITHGEVGCQHRVSEFADLFAKSGFEVRDVYVNMSAPAEYLAEFEPRLRRSASKYRAWEIAELGKISASFCVRKPR